MKFNQTFIFILIKEALPPGGWDKVHLSLARGMDSSPIKDGIKGNLKTYDFEAPSSSFLLFENNVLST
jgi:hypothetical protein